MGKGMAESVRAQNPQSALEDDVAEGHGAPEGGAIRAWSRVRTAAVDDADRAGADVGWTRRDVIRPNAGKAGTGGGMEEDGTGGRDLAAEPGELIVLGAEIDALAVSADAIGAGRWG
jgi:hypothetical protein